MFIREMAKRVHLSEDTLRYYEKIGLLAHVTRDAGGHRVYGEVEIEEVQKIVYLKASGLSLNDIRNYLELMQGGERRKRTAAYIITGDAENIASEDG